MARDSEGAGQINYHLKQNEPTLFTAQFDSSWSGQDESNPVLWLATRASYLARSGLPAMSRKKYFPKSHILNPPLSTSTPSWSINTQEKELGQYPVILTSHLVNNPYTHDSHIMQLVHCACIIRGHVSDLQCTVVGSTMTSFSLQTWQAAFSTLFCFRSCNSLTFKIYWQQTTDLKHWVTQKNLKMAMSG